MNKFYIEPRRSGKTSKLINTLSVNRGSSLLVVRNQQMKTHIMGQYPNNIQQELIDSIVTVHELCNMDKWRGRRGNTLKILIDEYLFLNTMEKQKLYVFYKRCLQLNIDIEWIIRTTSNMLFDRVLLDLTNEIKQCPNPTFVLENLEYKKFKEIEDKYWCNFLTEPGWEVISENRKYEMSAEHYRMEILGDFLK